MNWLQAWRRLFTGAARFALILGLSACHGPAPLTVKQGALPAPPPNIILVLADDLGWNDVGYHGSDIRTPNIDRLAAEGIVLRQHRVYPVCSPTRAALLSGQNPLRFGIDGPMENDAMLPAGLKLLPEYLREAGYRTWLVGKWHLGMLRRSALPTSRGFDYFYGHLGGFIDYYTHVYFGGLDWQRNGQTVRETGYSTDLLTDDAIRLISQHDSRKPFFLYLAYNAPHTPLQYPPGGRDGYADIADPDRRVYAQMTTYLDTSFGRILRALEAKGIMDDTLLVFMSDNGGNLEAGSDNGQLREGKGSVLEGGTRVPAIVYWPRGGLAGGTISDLPVFAEDWLPTLLDVATGTTASLIESDGQSVLSELQSGATTGGRPPVVIGVGTSRAAYDWPWKLVQLNNRRYLYNLKDDPFETRDVLNDNMEVAKTLEQLIISLPMTESKGARGPKPESLFRDKDGHFNYEIRMPETRRPWADSVIDE